MGYRWVCCYDLDYVADWDSLGGDFCTYVGPMWKPGIIGDGPCYWDELLWAMCVMPPSCYWMVYGKAHQYTVCHTQAGCALHDLPSYPNLFCMWGIWAGCNGCYGYVTIYATNMYGDQIEPCHGAAICGTTWPSMLGYTSFSCQKLVRKPYVIWGYAGTTSCIQYSQPYWKYIEGFPPQSRWCYACHTHIDHPLPFSVYLLIRLHMPGYWQYYIDACVLIDPGCVDGNGWVHCWWCGGPCYVFVPCWCYKAMLPYRIYDKGIQLNMERLATAQYDLPYRVYDRQVEANLRAISEGIRKRSPITEVMLPYRITACHGNIDSNFKELRDSFPRFQGR